MKRTKVMHWGLSFIRLMVSSSSSGVIGAAFSTTDSRFTWTQIVQLLLFNVDIGKLIWFGVSDYISVSVSGTDYKGRTDRGDGDEEQEGGLHQRALGHGAAAGDGVA